MSADRKGFRKGTPKSEETLGKMSASKMGNYNAKNQPNSLKIQVTDLETNISTTYDSIRAAERALNLNYGIITKYFTRNQQKPYKNRYVFVRSSLSKIRLGLPWLRLQKNRLVINLLHFASLCFTFHSFRFLKIKPNPWPSFIAPLEKVVIKLNQLT